MKKYFKRKTMFPSFLERDDNGPRKLNKSDLKLSKLPSNPRQQLPISSYNPNDRD